MLPISAESWSVGSLSEEGHPAVFWDDLAKFSQSIPPNFYLRISEQPVPSFFTLPTVADHVPLTNIPSITLLPCPRLIGCH